MPCQRVDPNQSQRGMSVNKVDNALVEPKSPPTSTSWRCAFSHAAYHIYQPYNHRSYYKIVSMSKTKIHIAAISKLFRYRYIRALNKPTSPSNSQSSKLEARRRDDAFSGTDAQSALA